MDANLAQAIRIILTADGDGRLRMRENYDFYFIHSLVNYARAKREAQKVTESLALCAQGRTEQTNEALFHKVLKEYVPNLEKEQIDALYEAINRDFEM
jgi:hypothetical protein